MTSTEQILLDIRAGPVVAPVIARVLPVLAARTGFDIDRIGDVLLVGDLLSALAGQLCDGRVRVAASTAEGVLELTVGRFASAEAARQAAVRHVVDGVPVLARLCDRIEIDGRDLRLCLSAGGRD